MAKLQTIFDKAILFEIFLCRKHHFMLKKSHEPLTFIHKICKMSTFLAHFAKKSLFYLHLMKIYLTFASSNKDDENLV